MNTLGTALGGVASLRGILGVINSRLWTRLDTSQIDPVIDAVHLRHAFDAHIGFRSTMPLQQRAFRVLTSPKTDWKITRDVLAEVVRGFRGHQLVLAGTKTSLGLRDELLDFIGTLNAQILTKAEMKLLRMSEEYATMF